MYYKINGYELEKCPKNAKLKNGIYVSNLESYFEQYPQAAIENGYYKLAEDNKPDDYDIPCKYVVSYKVINNLIETIYTASF